VRSIPYAILSGLLATLYWGLVLIGQRLFAAATGEETLVFQRRGGAGRGVRVHAAARERPALAGRLYGRDPLALRHAFDQAGRELLSALDGYEVRRSVEAAIEPDPACTSSPSIAPRDSASTSSATRGMPDSALDRGPGRRRPPLDRGPRPIGGPRSRRAADSSSRPPGRTRAAAPADRGRTAGSSQRWTFSRSGMNANATTSAATTLNTSVSSPVAGREQPLPDEHQPR